MLETESCRMQSKSLRLPTGMPGQDGTITLIPEHRVARFGKMDANLVSLSGL
jgi:hypothetical protein